MRHRYLCLYLCQQTVGQPQSAGCSSIDRPLQTLGLATAVHVELLLVRLVLVLTRLVGLLLRLLLLLCSAPLALDCLGLEGTLALALGRAWSLMPLTCLAHPVWWSFGR